jgi:hypothetical protein
VSSIHSATAEPRTCEQGTADCFNDRQLSDASSTIADPFIAVASIIHSVNKDESIVEALASVLPWEGYGIDNIGSTVKLPEDVVNRRKSDSEDAEEEGAELKDDAGVHGPSVQRPSEINGQNDLILNCLSFQKKDYKLPVVHHLSIKDPRVLASLF